MAPDYESSCAAIMASALWAMGCNPAPAASESQPRPSTSVASATSTSPMAPAEDHAPVGSALPALQAESWLVKLPLTGSLPGFVSVPLGATSPRPVMVALHGAGDRPEWACGGWRGATDAYPFILCPSGVSYDGKVFAQGSLQGVKKEIHDGLEALRARFGNHVAEGPAMMVGFSLGAIRLADILRNDPSLSPVAALAEGAYESMTPAFAKRFAKDGRRLLLVCSNPACRASFSAAVPMLVREGIDAKVCYSGGHVHNLDGEMVRALREDWPWVVRDDVRWGESFLASRRQAPGR